MRKKHGSVPKIHTCSGPDSRNEQTPALKVPLQMEPRFRPRGYEQPLTLEDPRGDKAPAGSPPPAPAAATTTSALAGRTAAAMAPGWTPLQQRPRPRPRSRGEDKYKEPEARSVDGGGDPVGDRDFSSRRYPGTGDRRRLPTRILTDERRRPPRGDAYRGKGRTTPEHERRPSSVRRLGRSSGTRDTTTALAARGGPGAGPAEPASPMSWSQRRSPPTSPALSKSDPQEIELRLSPAPAPARMMNILEAEGGTKIAARFASPHHRTGGHRLG
jgi:hypothetical protein